MKRKRGTASMNMDSQMEQTSSMFCTYDSGVVRCQSQHQFHFWRMNSMFEAYCTGKWAWQLSIKFVSFISVNVAKKKI